LPRSLIIAKAKMMILSNAIAILKKAKIKQAKQEVWDLLAVALNKNKSEVILTHRPTDKIMSKKFDAYIKKRAGGFPFAYVVGYQPFLGQNYLVTKDTLIPRPATEDLVLAVEKYLSPVRNNFDSTRGNNYSSKHQINAKRDNISNGINIFDIGTGSGCMAISLALRCPDKIKKITATDISTKALTPARKNSRQLLRQLSAYSCELADKKKALLSTASNLTPNSRELENSKKVKIIFKKADLLKKIILPKNCLVLANLPYVNPHTKNSIGKCEPKSAIFCNYKNGLPIIYLKLFEQIKKQKYQPSAVFLEMPHACSARFQKLWRATLPLTPLFIISA